LDEQDQSERVAVFERFCRERGIPLTSQRRAILETVLELDDHPTADEVHDLVAQRIPGVSRTTVYRTLETLDRSGVITKVAHAGRAIRYDRRIEVHHHLVCLRCDRIVDLSDPELDTIRLPDTSTLGFKAVDHRVQLRGICLECRKQEEGP